MLGRGYDEAQTSDAISRDYGANKEIVRADVIEFIETLQKHHILQPSRVGNII